MGRHKTKNFAFPTTREAHQDKEILAKPLKEYRDELNQIKQIMKQKKAIRKRGKIQSDVSKCTLPDQGQITGGLRHDRKKKKQVIS